MRFSLLLVLLLIGGSVSAQTLTGVVVDGNGAALSGATVALINRNLPAVRTNTDDEGNFALSGTISEQGRLTVRAQGFAPYERKLANDGVRHFTVILQPAQVTGDVTV